jgi:eukaryotic-like serine/threonine-protein kinase
VAAGIVVSRRERALPLDQNLIAVAPFDVVDADLKLWHEGMVDVLSRNLDGAGPLRTVSPTLIVRRWAGRADKESAAALGRSTGAKLAVVGSLLRSGGDSVRASASLIDASSGRVLGEVERKDALSRMDRLSDSLTIGLLRELGKSRALGGAQMSSVGTTSLPALKAFLEGQQYFRKSAWDSAVANYDRAIESDTTFSIALMYDGLAHGWVGGANDSAATSNLQRAARFNHGLSPRDSLLVVANGEFAQLGAAQNALPFGAQLQLFATLHEGVRRYANDPEMWYALGDAQYHWGWGDKVGVPESEVLRSFDRAIALDSAFTPAYLHAIEIGFRYGTPTGRRYLLAYLAQSPTDYQADGMRLADRLTDPARAATPETRQILDTASIGQLGSLVPAILEWPDSGETLVGLAPYYLRAKSHDHPVDSATRLRRVASGMALRGHLRSALATDRTSSLLMVALLAGDAPAATDSILFRQSSTGHACGDCAISVWGMIGDTMMIQKALRIVDSLAKSPKSSVAPGALQYTKALAHAYLALDRRDTVNALREFLSLPDSLCHECGWSWLTRAQLLESQGRLAEAAALLDHTSVLNTPMGVLTEFERARVAEKLGDKARARDGYAFVAGMWQRGDPFFLQYASDAREGLKRLSGEHSGVAIPINKR